MPDVDAFIDAAGAPALFDDVMRIVKPQARVSIIAVYKQDVPVSLGQIMSKEVQIRGASGYTHEDFARVVGHLSSRHASLAGLVTQVYKLDEIGAAFDKAIGAQGTVKVLIDLS
ncbi:zinc-binding dehydrogenase [Saccharibacillus sp. CPCC 101409]|uniref:zinc-binding dehydrogenase n=1 Tax=Saccharibacillus sp. CPCC 101409 TaxID=3058041 RepID=UPI0026733206|nr:zinc-binding dehydrogenase [Saccharibacillus sp. CPCC 101409]MDO3412625.1 zinc-binding dehydrogenase [Saccharibacillus sp. CPCC 101409]